MLFQMKKRTHTAMDILFETYNDFFQKNKNKPNLLHHSKSAEAILFNLKDSKLHLVS